MSDASLDGAVEKLRADCVEFFAAVPEPPVYRPADDPHRARAEKILIEATALLERARGMRRHAEGDRLLSDLIAVLERHEKALRHTVEGRAGNAEQSWQEAVELERQVLSARRLFFRTDEQPTKAYDRARGISRYDPRADAKVAVQLVCPRYSCRRVSEHGFSPTSSHQELRCPQCKESFLAYLATAEAESAVRRGSAVRYRFRLRSLSGADAELELDDTSGTPIAAARGDLLAFLYSSGRDLKVVSNLSSGRMVWVQRAGPCFIATAVFGENAPELVTFRAFRDQALMGTTWGKMLVKAYYSVGPHAARAICGRPNWTVPTRWILRRLHRKLKTRGYP